MLMIVDGNNIAMRSFHTPQGDLRSRRGEPTGVIFGVLNSVRSLLEKFPETNRVVVCWDKGKAAWRKAIYPEYKGNRTYGTTPEEKKKFSEFIEQGDFLHNFLPNLGIHSLKFDGQEADDLMYLTCQIVPGNKLLVTTDKDMFQLISDQTSVYSPYKDKVMGKSNFREEMGVSLTSYIGYRCLVGDPSDNINGIQGIGEKTAKGLMDKYGHVDNMLQDKLTLLKSKRTAKIFTPEGLHILGRNNKLMNLKYADLGDLSQRISEVLNQEVSVDSKKIKEVFVHKDFVSILSNYISWVSPFNGLGAE